ncbi:hypothetical protein LAG90_04135 [Marinilongibacter aquaticus]|uniref:hypothetical protein n=1 Tax=Marinilongibacter aquaticus TaxID=2975157 RepID=UPI0021BD7457|nr:hypothetical protein [Marinilongibacter aquaticus]UBM59836.1 hypothetical protein LAG90_04135 [Marinilongibacter aquaticus]
MVKNEVVEFILDLADQTDHATLIDFEMLSKLMDQYPDFDLLRKVFVDVGLFLGARGTNFENEKAIWESRKNMLTEKQISTVEKVENTENGSIHERYERFVKQFRPQYSPKTFQ